jgi:hypothetical protein
MKRRLDTTLRFRANDSDIKNIERAQEKLNAKTMSDTIRKALQKIAEEL